jgi:Tol biopolymer transport system component
LTYKLPPKPQYGRTKLSLKPQHRYPINPNTGRFFLQKKGPFFIATVRPDGTGLKVLTHTPGKAEGSPDWSPDERRLVFGLYNYATDGTRIDTVGADGTGRRTVFAPGRIGAGDPVFSPDGTKVAFSCADGIDIWTMNPDGTGLTDVTDTPSWKRWEGRPDWGPKFATTR